MKIESLIGGELKILLLNTENVGNDISKFVKTHPQLNATGTAGGFLQENDFTPPTPLTHPTHPPHPS